MEDGLENESGKKGLNSRYHNKATNNQSRELGDQSSIQVGNKDWQEQYNRNGGEKKRDDTKEMHGFVGTVESNDSENDFSPVGIGIKFRFTARWAVAIVDDNIGDRHVFINSMDAHFGFDFETV